MDAVPPWTAAFLADWMRPAGGPWDEAIAAGTASWRALLEACEQESLLTAGPWQSFWQFGKALRGYHERQPELGVREAMDSLLADLLSGIDLALSAEAALAASVPPAPEVMPAFGLWREWQKLGMAVTAAMQAERVAGITLRRRQWQALRDGARRLRERLGDAGDEAALQISSLHALYNLVIEQFEDAYQRELRTSAYAEAFGQHANAGLRLREAMSRLTEKTQRSLGLPTAADLEAIAQRLSVLEAAPVAPAPATDGLTAAPASISPATAPGAVRASPKPRAKRTPQRPVAAAVKAPAAAASRRASAPDFDIGGSAPRPAKRP